ncbi:unnamed protein product [Oppiella nova]|uniref:Uncharacterized protein n=1 Tax=Oppiella nova TaxID=334625 RepID=A0A7R9L9P6_9ACAR|nr:unnamed protein product [Oppiella nova]CAG2161080.1 unnamed protein product [Oppiella nova]
MALRVKQLSTLVGSCVLHLMVGSGNTLANLNTYMTSYLRQKASRDANFGESVWYTPVGVTAFTLFTIISGFIVNKMGTRVTCLLAAVVFSGSMALTSLALDNSFIMVLMSYALMAQIGNGLIYSSVIVNCIKWFPNNKGLVAGVITGINAFSSFIFTQIQTFYLNPNNVKPNSDGYFDETEMLSKVPKLFNLLSGIYAVMGLIGVCLIFDSEEPRPNHTVQTDPNDNPISTSMNFDDNEILVTTTTHSVFQTQYSIRHAINTRFFTMLWFTFAFSTQSVYFINSMIKAFGQSYINDDHYLSVILAFSFVANGIGGVFWGKVLDLLKFRDTIIVINGILATSTFSLIISSFFCQKLFFAIWDFVLFFAGVGVFASYLPEVVRKFGDTNAITIYGLIHTGPVSTK